MNSYSPGHIIFFRLYSNGSCSHTGSCSGWVLHETMVSEQDAPEEWTCDFPLLVGTQLLLWAVEHLGLSLDRGPAIQEYLATRRLLGTTSFKVVELSGLASKSS